MAAEWITIARDVALIVLAPFGAWAVAAHLHTFRRLVSALERSISIPGSIMTGHLEQQSADVAPVSSRRLPPLPSAARAVLEEVPAVLLPAQVQALALAAPRSGDLDELVAELDLRVSAGSLPEEAPAFVLGRTILIDERRGARFWFVLWGCAHELMRRHGHEAYRADVWILAQALARLLTQGRSRGSVH